MKTFTAIIQHNPENGGCWVEVPFDVKKEFGSLRPKVKVIFEGKLTYRGSLVRMGSECHILGVRKDIRVELDKGPGDNIHVALELDQEERKVEIPELLQSAFKVEPAARKYFDSLSYTQQREHVNYITEAKKEETRLRRIEKTIATLLKNSSTKK